MASQSFNLNLNINANANTAQNQLKNLQKQLQDISNMKIDLGTSNLTADIEKASEAAMKLSAHLATATNPQTGNLDFTKFYTSIQKSGASLEDYGKALQNMGPAGQKAFVSLADSISKAEIPLKRTSKLVDGMWDNLKKTVGWQLSSSMVHGFIGSVQQAVGYAKDLNKSLTDIRIVTGQSTDQMAQFAKQANQAAKNLSTTTTDYTRASLIYYQQGLSDQEVKARTETTIKMANATGTSAQKVSDQMTAIWNNYDNGTKSLTHYADVMTALGAATASSTDEIAEGLQKFAAISDTVGLSYEYAASALATITSTSRESADVVGNSLKTLFSRIQGLQLGETLDDGTTLNKYSTALAKVGISIKDSSGELKDMDLILDEMGDKWETLARDEQMALAQTVAGVRQYTQLMTLMENWDSFKQNLNIANTSAGTLDQQAVIYAESWEAASQRVRAAWEGVWDNMIDSNSAVEVLDFVANLVNGLDSMITSLGGAKGVLTTFGGLLTKIFAPKISETIADTAYNIRMMLPGAQKREETKRQSMLETLQNAMSSGHLDMGSYESRIRNATISSRLKESQIQAERERAMTDEEKLWDREFAKQLEKNRDLQVQNAQEIDAAANARANLAIDDIGLDKLDSEYKTGGQLYRDMALAGEKAYDDSRNYTDETREEAFNRAVNLEKQYYDINRKQNSGTGKTVREMFNETFNQNQKFLNAFDTSDINKAKDSLKSFAEETGQSVKNLDERLNEFGTDEEKKAFLDQYAQKLVNNNRDRMINNMDIDTDEDGLTIEELDKSRQKYRDYYDKLAEIETKKQRGEQLTEQEQNIINQRNKLGTKKVNWSDAFVGASQGLWASVAALEALKSFANDPSLLSLAGMVGNSVEAFDGFNTLFKAFPGKIGKFSSQLALGAMAFITAFDLIGEALEKYENRFQRQAEQAATSAQELQTAYNTNQSNHTKLLNTIEEYKNSESKLKDVTLSSKERADAEYEHNRMVANMISDYNLQEGDYSRVGNQLIVSQQALNNITDASQERVNASRTAADQGIVNAKEAANEAEINRLRNSMTEASGKNGDIGNTLLKIGGGLLVGAGVAALATIALPALLGAGGAIAAGMGASGALAGLGLGGALEVGTLGSSTLGGVLAGAGLLGAGSMALGARTEQDFADYNFADKALEIIEKRKGDTSWLNSIETIMTEGFSKDQAKIVYQYRDSLESLSSSMKAAELAGEAVAENAARNAVATDEAAKSSSQQSKIAEGATEIYKEAAEEQKKTTQETFDKRNKQNKFDAAEAVKDELGLSDLEGFEWEDDDRKNERLTYSYIDESGKVQQGAVSYDSVIEAQSSKSGITAVNAYTDQMLQAYKDLKVVTGDSDTAGGLFALLTGGNFESATNKEITAAQEYLKTFEGNAQGLLDKLGMSAEEFSESYGMSAESFINTWTNYQTASQRLLNSTFSGNEGYQKWQSTNQDLLDSISQETGLKLYDNLNQISTLGGEGAGMAFLDGLSYILNSEGLDASDTAQVMESLMALDWSSATIGTDITSVVSSLGGTIDTATAAWQNFISAMMAASGAVPDFSTLLSQLTELIGLLGQVKPGDIIDDSLLSSLLEKFPEFRDLVMKQWDGSYKFIGTENDLQDYQNRLNNEYQANYQDMLNAANLLEQYTGKGGALEGFDGSKLTFDDLLSAENGSALRNLLASYMGTTSGELIGDLFDAKYAYNLAAKELNQWSQGNEGVNIDGQAVFRDKNGNFVDVNGNAVDEVIRGKAESMYLEDQTSFNSAMAAMQQFVTILQSLLGMSPDEITKDANEQKASTYDTYEKFEEGITNGDATIVNEDGSLTDAGSKQLINIAQQYENTTAAVKEYQAALEAVKEAEGTENEDAANQRLEEAQSALELATAIGEVAAARGQDAETLALIAEGLPTLVEYKDAEGNVIEVVQRSAQAIADEASEMLAASEAAEDLSKSVDNLYRDINGLDPTKSTKKLRELEKQVQKLIGTENDAISANEKYGKTFRDFLKNNPDKVKKAIEGDTKAILELQDAQMDGAIQDGWLKSFEGLESEAETAETSLEEIGSSIQQLGNDILALQAQGDWNIGESISASMGTAAQSIIGVIQALGNMGPAGMKAAAAIGEALGFDITWQEEEFSESSTTHLKGVHTWVDEITGFNVEPGGEADNDSTTTSKIKIPIITPKGTGAPAGGGGGGGGGGGAKEPKKVAQTRRSQVVKRYKNIDAQRATNENRRDNMSKKTEKLYGEARVTNLEKENKLLEEGLRLNQKKSEEAMKNLKLDQEALVTVGQKYGYEVKFDSEGNLENYEEILGDLYDQLHALEADNLMDESEEKVKEEIEIKKTEIEGAIEDLEDTLEQLQELNNEYEEMIDEMHENNLEKITYRLEFELELNELDTEWNDFLLEQIDDDFTQTAAAMDLVTKKITTASENIEHYKQSVTDLIEFIENDPDRSLITGYLEDGVLTDEEAEILKEAYSGIIEQIEAIAEAKEEAEDRLISIFEGYNERIDLDMTSLEHYASLLEHFGNVVDIVGQKQLGLSDKFMETMSNMRIDQSRDIMSAAQTNLSAMQKIKAEAEAELEKAREEGRTNDIDYWQERLDEANTAIEESRDELVAAFENSLTAIADAFDAAMERVIDTFNNTIYAFGGLEGLSADYAIMKETSDLIAADYEKIYELSKITRNINKTLSDSNIIAGKQKMLDLQKEINELQANGTEMSKYDLEYLQAKYELRLAEIELENAQNNKDTVRLSKDSEGNWSYIYTSSTDAVEEAQQKYEDALYNMQNLSYEYIDEMSEKIVSASQSMAEEIAAIDKTKFKDEVELMEEVNRIKQKYAEQLGLSEEELNKALANNNDLYNQDWQLYNQKTGYAVSSAQDWIDSYRETALGQLTGSESDVSDYMDNFLAALDELTESIKRVASDYYFNVNETMKAAGITKDDFGNFVLSNTTAINKASENTKKNIETQTQNLVKDFNTQADKVTENQRILNDYVEENRDYLEWIKNWLNESSQKTKEQQGKDATYTYKEAAELFNSKYANIANGYKIELTEDGKWSKTIEGVKNEILSKHQAAKESGDKELQAHYADMYTWLTSYILPYTTSLDTGGYTGAWGTSGKLAMLHEKELVLNAEDTTNFLDALHISRDIINSMIEMNARQSSYALGGMTPGVLQDMSQKLEQQVSIVAEFPNATDHNEIEEAFNNLINTASQYANKYNI